MSQPDLVIFYDSLCPLCTSEMDRLKELDINKKLGFASLQDSNTLKAHPDLDVELAMTILQGKLPNGDYIQGLDVTHKAWSAVGKGHMTFILRLPILKWVFDRFYLMFASNRYRISACLTGQAYNANCDRCIVNSELESEQQKHDSKQS